MKWKFLNLFLYKIKVIKIAKILRINPQFFFDLVIFHFSKLFRANVDDNLIIFGAANGKAFMGNPKYLYNFLRENTDYKLVWLSKSKELIRELRSQGVLCISNFSLEAIKLLRRARAVFVSHGWNDVLPVRLPPRTVAVQTWHGGFIKIKGKNPYFNRYINSKWTAVTRTKIRYYQFFNYVISASSDKKLLDITSSVFKFPLEKIITTGYPRNDILFSNDPQLVKELKIKYQIPNHIERVILYAPTYRERKFEKEPFNNEEIVKLSDYCEETDTIFLIKVHINEKIINYKYHNNIKVIRKDTDIQELLLISDMLITDYSSVICDYLLLERPILLYTYDYDNYINHRGIYYNHLEDIAPGPLIYSASELFNAIKNTKEIEKQYRTKVTELRKFFNTYSDGKSSERLLRFLKLIN